MVQLAELVQTSHLVAASRARSEKIARLGALLRRARGPTLAIAVAFLSGALRQGKIGIGSALLRAAAEVPPAQHPTLSLADVDAVLTEVAAEAGRGAAAARRARLGALFARATRSEQEFLVALLQGELRQGAVEGLLASAVARAFELDVALVQRAAMLRGELPAVARLAEEGGAAALAGVRLEVGRAIQPMLAQTADDARDALARLGPVAAAEWKLDGARVQVHRAGGEVHVFTRAGHDVTAAVPELVSATLALPVPTLVLDGETLALRPDGRPLPFQTTMQRFGRRFDVARLRESVPLSVFHFDLLHADGEDLIDRPAAERRARLEACVPAAQCTPRRLVESIDSLEIFSAEALAAGHEGVMVKSPTGLYEAGRRGAGWLKWKPVHTLDLVVLAAEWGSGRRRGWLSNLHLGARDPETGGFVMLGKTFKGLTDALLAWQTERLLSLETARDVHTVYVRPALVVEIAFDGVQQSPHYPGGVTLRFARVKGYRSDKPAGEADTLATVRRWLAPEGDAGRG